MSVLTLPGHRAPHVLADYVALRRCRVCGECTDRYFEGSVMQAERISAWGPRSLRRMARELDIPPSSLRDKESGNGDFSEDEAREYLTSLGIL